MPCEYLFIRFLMRTCGSGEKQGMQTSLHSQDLALVLQEVKHGQMVYSQAQESNVLRPNAERSNLSRPLTIWVRSLSWTVFMSFLIRHI